MHFGFLHLSNALFRRSITISSFKIPGWYSSKDDHALDIKKAENRYYFGLEASTRGKLIFVFSLFGEVEQSNLQINCINRLLTALFIFSTPPTTTICQRFAPRFGFFPGAARFLYTHSLSLFSPHLLHSYHFRQLSRMNDPLLKIM